MIPKGLINYSANEIERLARDHLRRRPDIEFRPPINIEMLVEAALNVTLKVVDGLRSRHRVEGGVCKHFMSRDVTVIVDADVLNGPWQNYRAVLGEEYGHLILHESLLHYVNEIEDFIELQADAQWPRFERDARQFSAAIRMPPALIIREAEITYPRLVNEFGFGDSMLIERLLRNRLAEIFVVAPDEMQSRLIGFPCHLRDRIATSVRQHSMRLLPDSWSVPIRPPIVQRHFDLPE